jgi:uncharacterized membrane protein YhaH (DUF805 family)
LFFLFKGRVSRAAFFLAGLLLVVIQLFVVYRFTLVPQETAESQLWASLFSVTFLVSIWANVALGVKRLHDLGRPGIFAVVLFIPVISIVAFIALCLMPGEPGPNRYGSDTNSSS